MRLLGEYRNGVQRNIGTCYKATLTFLAKMPTRIKQIFYYFSSNYRIYNRIGVFFFHRMKNKYRYKGKIWLYLIMRECGAEHNLTLFLSFNFFCKAKIPVSNTFIQLSTLMKPLCFPRFSISTSA